MAEENEKKLEPIFSVSEYIEFINISLRKIGEAKITGEITRFTVSNNGHAYFNLKDKSGEAVLDCIIWKSNYALCGVKLEEGIEVVLSGYPDIYPGSGRFSFKAQTIELKGEGALKKAYEELKNRLDGEGLFAEAKKRPIPKYPREVGIITSKQGAVLADFLNNLGSFGFKIKMIDSRVEGQEAVGDLLSSIKSFKKQNIEVLVIMRGGGSLESLMPFNNERLVREVAAFPVPVVAAIGHDKDVPLMALAADNAQSTPTAAANFLSESWSQAQFKVERCERNIMNPFSMRLSETDAFLNEFVYLVKEKFGAILARRVETENKLRIFVLRLDHALAAVKNKIQNGEKLIASYSPERQLKLGYSIARQAGRLIKSVKNVRIGEDMQVQVFDGTIKSKITSKI